MMLGEVVEIKTGLKNDPKDDKGNPIALGSIEVRIGGSSSNLGQIRNIYARPAVFNTRFPAIGEIVMLFTGPANDWSTTSNKGTGIYYMSPINATDDMTLHSFWKIYSRKGLAAGSQSGQRKADQEEPGYSFPKNPKKIDPLQQIEGHDIYQGRFGQSIRFGTTVLGDTSVYAKKPSWKGSTNADPIMILRVSSKSGAGNKYTIEDLKDDDSSIYLTSKQSLSSLKAGFNKNMDAKQIGNWMGGSQIVLDADRLILNAKSDMAFLIGSKQATITGKKVLFQSDKYKVDLDELMDFLKKWLDLDQALSSASATYATSCGPTAVSTNMADYLKLKTADFMKFKQP